MLGINKELMWIACGQIIGLLNNFFLLKILTVSLSMTEYGYYTLWMSVMLFIRQIIYDPLSIILAKESIEKNPLGIVGACGFQILRYLSDRMFLIILSFGVILVFLYVIFYNKIELAVYTLMGVIYLISNGAQGIYLNILNTLRKRKWAAAGIAVDSFIKLSLVFVTFFIFEKSLIFTIQAIAISSLLAFIWVRSISTQFYAPRIVAAYELFYSVEKLLILSLPLFAPTLLIAIKGVGDKVFMAAFIGVEDLAAYNVLLQVGFIPMMLIIGVIQTYVSPDIYKLTAGESAVPKNTVSYINMLGVKILFFSTAAIGASILLSDITFRILVGSKYIYYSKYLPYFVLAGALAGMSGLLNVGVIGAFKPKLVGLLMFSSVLVGLIIFTVSIAIHGFEGGIIGLVLSNFVIMLFFYCSLWLIPYKKN